MTSPYQPFPARPAGVATLDPVRTAALKVPQVTALFWIIKVLTTGMGETTSDFLVRQFDPVVVIPATALALAAALLLQLRLTRYVAWAYWLAVALVSVFGTMAADVLHAGAGIPYLVSTGFFAAALAAVLYLWKRTEKTLSIHSINTRRREVFYWLTVLATFALGTAAGDLAASTFQLGYLGSGILFALLIAIPAVGFHRFKINATLAFWSAYILTRPLGACFADWMGVPATRGGLDWGTGPVSLVLAAAIAVLVAFLSITRADLQKEP
ncbi:COG4705 family protein [Arthrobacter sp. 35W]|uniref:COG4705 family protein n=1 Tax=Arthrobacter sp. 35W TaxID=1132441 RepID=UPI0006883A8A|nr:hypothetical protein [Arthrobacter sp. 35W]